MSIGYLTVANAFWLEMHT